MVFIYYGSSGTYIPGTEKKIASVTFDNESRIYPVTTVRAVDSLDRTSGEEGTERTKGRGCMRGGLGEGGERGEERAAAEEPRPKGQGKTPRGAVQVLLTAWTRS